MALPEKHYFYLQELVKRWKVSELDIRYYAENGLIRMETFLPEIIARLYKNKKTEDGDTAKVCIGVGTYNGYASISPAEVRKVFSQAPQPIDCFCNPANDQIIEPIGFPDKLTLRTDDLVVSKSEIDRFEKEHEIKSSSEKPPSFAGRPSLMGFVLKEFEKRCQEGKVENTLSAEGKALASWAEHHIDSPQTPKQRSIMNAIRTQYQKYKQK